MFTETWALDNHLFVAYRSQLNWSLKFQSFGRSKLEFSCQTSTDFDVGYSVDCLDQFGVCSKASIEIVCEGFVAAIFPKWPKEFHRAFENRGEIREKSSLHATERKEEEIE